MNEHRLCYWCHEPLPPLPEDASCVDEINHYIHDECRDERDDNNRRREQLRVGIVDGSIDSIPIIVRQAVLDRIQDLGFARRCPSLSRDAVGPAAATTPGGKARADQDHESDADHGFQGYESHSYATGDDDDVDDLDVRNSVDGCDLCGGSGSYDPLPRLLDLTDAKAVEAWIAEEVPRSSEPCDHWTGFPERGWYYDALGYNRVGKGPVRGVTLYNPDLMMGGVITLLEIADLFRPRVQSSLF
ncbi:MAG: hypothetical protein H0V97_09155 [Actinobacteria bacterium]|nr:hypothetical protein [Actinomycetota bacterium]